MGTSAPVADATGALRFSDAGSLGSIASPNHITTGQQRGVFMLKNRRVNASFAWDILQSDIKLIAYPLLRIVMMLVLLALMWPLIFDLSTSQMYDTVSDLSTQASQVNADGDTSGQAGQTTQSKQMSSDVNRILDSIHFGWLLVFIGINLLIGIVSTGALTGQAIAIIRGERRSLGYGYGMAILRFPQLFVWWLITMVVGLLLQSLERHRVVGLIIAGIIGLAWSVLTFFSITSIMATGCGPIGAIKKSKNTIKDAWHKAKGDDGDLKHLRRGFYVGGAFAIVNLILVFGLLGLLWLEFGADQQHAHHVSIGVLATIIVMLYINGAFMSAMWAIIKAAVYIWAEEGRLPDSVDESVMENAFYRPSLSLKS